MIPAILVLMVASIVSIRSLKDTDVSRKDVESFLAAQNTYTLHKDKRTNFPRNRIIAIHKDYQWAADLADMASYARQNSGFRFILTVIDVFTKYLWLRPIKNKKPETVRDAFRTIFSGGRQPIKLRTDRGKEFVGKPFTDFLKEHDIVHLLTTNKTYKAATVERVQRTLKGRMFRYFTRIGSHKYIDKLEDFVTSYNNSYHRAIKMTPNEAISADRKTVFRNLYGVDSVLDLKSGKQAKLKKGDTVRLAYDKGVFDKGYWHTFTDQTATVKEVINKPLPMYALKDFTGTLQRHFYNEELQKIPEPAYRVEKVIKTRIRNGKRQYYVKFVGYPSSENSWG